MAGISSHTPLLSASLYEPISRLGRARRFPIFDDPHHVHQRPQLLVTPAAMAGLTPQALVYPNEVERTKRIATE
jgi:hypothetical protein